MHSEKRNNYLRLDSTKAKEVSEIARARSRPVQKLVPKVRASV